MPLKRFRLNGSQFGIAPDFALVMLARMIANAAS